MLVIRSSLVEVLGLGETNGTACPIGSSQEGNNGEFRGDNPSFPTEEAAQKTRSISRNRLTLPYRAGFTMR